MAESYWGFNAARRNDYSRTQPLYTSLRYFDVWSCRGNAREYLTPDTIYSQKRLISRAALPQSTLTKKLDACTVASEIFRIIATRFWRFWYTIQSLTCLLHCFGCSSEYQIHDLEDLHFCLCLHNDIYFPAASNFSFHHAFETGSKQLPNNSNAIEQQDSLLSEVKQRPSCP